jgi:hypothetical protein
MSCSPPQRHDDPTVGYDRFMSHMDHERDRPLEMEDVPEGEEIAEGDAAERIDEDPDEQANRQDPVWDDDGHED